MITLIIELYIGYLVIKTVLSLVFWSSVGAQIKEKELTTEPNNIIINRIRGRGL